MPDGVLDFAPLSAEEQVRTAVAIDQAGKVPLVPVPANAPLMNYRHPKHGLPSATYEYRLATGELAGYACRFDFVTSDGQPDKDVLPVTYCAFGDGRFGWRAKGIPAPRPLYRLHDLLARPEAPVLVCEGEKTTNAAAGLFPDYVATTPMHGAKSPHKTDWSPLAGRSVIIWPDHDAAGDGFAGTVACLVTAAGAASVAIVEVPRDWPAKWDVADQLPPGVDPESLRELLASALPWQQPQWPTEVKAERQYHSFGCYRMDNRGLYYVPESKGGKQVWPIRLSDPFEVLAQTRDPRSSNWGLLLRWIDRDGKVHEWAMPWEALGGGREEIWRCLMREGLSISPTMVTRNHLAEYLSQVQPEARACGLSRIGWHLVGDKMAYVLPDETFGETGGERVLWQTEARTETFFNCAGTLEGWKSEIAAKCVSNSRLGMSVSAAFSGPLLTVADEESGGLHLKGGSRFGKTVALRVGGSVWGGGGVLGFLRTWRATSNGLEGIAEAHNDAFLCLDEIGQVEAREAGEIAYMLANGTGKGRAGRDGSPRRSAQWRLIFLSTGEVSLADKLAEIGRAPKAGQEVRLVEIPADAGAGYGIFENLHGAKSGGEFAESLRAATTRHYGTPIRRFLELLAARYNADPTGLHQLIKKSRDEFMAKHLPLGASGQVRSVCGRFALVAAAGSLATAFGLTGWPDDEADCAAGICFRAWLSNRGGKGDHEIEGGIRQVVAFVEMHGSSRFEHVDAAPSERVLNRVGYREQDQDGSWHYYVLPESWKREVAKGYGDAALVKAMVERRLILPGKDGKPAMQKKVKGQNQKMYALALGIIGGDDTPEGGYAG